MIYSGPINLGIVNEVIGFNLGDAPGIESNFLLFQLYYNGEASSGGFVSIKGDSIGEGTDLGFIANQPSNFAARLSQRAVIDPNLFDQGSAYKGILAAVNVKGNNSSGNWLGGDRGYIGVRFQLDGNDHFGWFDIGIEENNFTTTIFGYAWEDQPGVSIAAGAIPEPGSLQLLALGALGLLAWRQKKKSIGSNDR